jgi:hypothetical protein
VLSLFQPSGLLRAKVTGGGTPRQQRRTGSERIFSFKAARAGEWYA